MRIGENGEKVKFPIEDEVKILLLENWLVQLGRAIHLYKITTMSCSTLNLPTGCGTLSDIQLHAVVFLNLIHA